ncbi:MAG: ATP phosphoribosyltransferase regulatory subunit [Bacillota bacterium]
MAKLMAWRVPEGVKDWLPGEAWKKRELENRLAKLFQQWAYQEVVTPTIEFYHTFQSVETMLEDDMVYKFIDRQGPVLALRPDMTTPIARLTVSRLLKGQDAPLRLFYIANVFRYESGQAGRQREFYQAGVELVGAKGPWADAEVIALAIEALRSAGLEDFRLGIGQISVTKRLLAELDLPPGEIQMLKQAMSKKDLVKLEKILEKAELSPGQRELIMGVYNLHGGNSVLQKVFKLIKDEEARLDLENLAEVWEALQAYNVADQVFFDLGLLRDFEYYTGVVFEGYAPGLGFPVCGGGRYDNLLERFGCSCPATGFALGIERVMMANPMARVAVASPPDYLVAGANHAKVLQTAAQLRQAGAKVEVELSGRLGPELSAYARSKGIKEVIAIGED